MQEVFAYCQRLDAVLGTLQLAGAIAIGFGFEAAPLCFLQRITRVAIIGIGSEFLAPPVHAAFDLSEKGSVAWPPFGQVSF